MDEADLPEPTQPGKLFVVATPIGNLEDITLRAIRILGEVDALACEDTRQTRKIYDRHEMPRPSEIFSYREHNERRAGTRILELLGEGRTVALCTDAGYPGVSDPGYRVVSEALEQGFHVEVIPGPSAVITALVASGLPTSSYTFKGFPPRKGGPLKRFLETDRDLPHTLVFFESPYRVGALLKAALNTLGNRKAAVCIELTKMFETVHRGFLSDLAEEFESKTVRGEVTVVVAGNNPKFAQSDGDVEEEDALAMQASET